jgi:hypothetical protein
MLTALRVGYGMDEKFDEMVRLLRMRAEIQDIFDGPNPGRWVLRWLMKRRRGEVLIVPPRSGAPPPRCRPEKRIYRWRSSRQQSEDQRNNAHCDKQ